MSERSMRSLGVPNRVIFIQKCLLANFIMKKSQVPHNRHKISNSGNTVWDIVISPVGVFSLNSCVGCGSLPDSAKLLKASLLLSLQKATFHLPERIG